MFEPLRHLPSEEFSVKARDHVFRAGHGAHHIYFVVSGRVVLTRYTDGNSVVIADIVQGNWMAEASLFEPTYHCDAVAVVESHLLRVRCEDVCAALRDDPAFALRYVEYLSTHVRRLREELEIRASHSPVLPAAVIRRAPNVRRCRHMPVSKTAP